jgi:hypothetical protein
LLEDCVDLGFGCASSSREFGGKGKGHAPPVTIKAESNKIAARNSDPCVEVMALWEIPHTWSSNFRAVSKDGDRSVSEAEQSKGSLDQRGFPHAIWTEDGDKRTNVDFK